MGLPYTYWKSSDGWFVGYWNDYPDYSMQGKSLRELQFVFRDLRNVITGNLQPVPRHREIYELTARANIRKLSAPPDSDNS